MPPFQMVDSFGTRLAPSDVGRSDARRRGTVLAIRAATLLWILFLAYNAVGWFNDAQDAFDVSTEVPDDEPRACPQNERTPLTFDLTLRGNVPSEPGTLPAGQQTFVRLVGASRHTGLLSGIGEPTVNFIDANDEREVIRKQVRFPDGVFVRHVDLPPGEYQLHGRALVVELFTCTLSADPGTD